MTPVNAFGVAALSFMLVMYTLEGRHRVFIAGLAAGCLASSAYGFLAGAWPFGVVEAIWCGVAVARYTRKRNPARPAGRAHTNLR